MDTTTVHPETLAGDSFAAKPAPHACADGWVTIGHEVRDEETGEESIEYALSSSTRFTSAAAAPANLADSTAPIAYAAATSRVFLMYIASLLTYT